MINALERPKVLLSGPVVDVIPERGVPATCVCLPHGRSWFEGAAFAPEGSDPKPGVEACRPCSEAARDAEPVELLAALVALEDLSMTRPASLVLSTALMSEIVYALRRSDRPALAELVRVKTGCDAPGPMT